MIRIRGMANMGELNTTVTVDPIVVNGQVTDQAGALVQGRKTPIIPPSWWPWIIAAGALGAMWWLTSNDDDDDDDEEGDDDDRPFDA